MKKEKGLLMMGGRHYGLLVYMEDDTPSAIAYTVQRISEVSVLQQLCETFAWIVSELYLT